MCIRDRALGAVTGALMGKFRDVGIDDRFIRDVQAKVQPGQSALFLLVREVTLDRVLAALQPYHPEVLQTSLSAEQEAQLRAALGGAPPEAVAAAAAAVEEPAAPAADGAAATEPTAAADGPAAPAAAAGAVVAGAALAAADEAAEPAPASDVGVAGAGMAAAASAAEPEAGAEGAAAAVPDPEAIAQALAAGQLTVTDPATGYHRTIYAACPTDGQPAAVRQVVKEHGGAITQVTMRCAHCGAEFVAAPEALYLR